MNASSLLAERLPADVPLPMDLLLLSDETPEAIFAYLHDSEVWVCQQQDIVAVACVLVLDAGCVELKNLAVAEGMQGQGIGGVFIQQLKQHYRATHTQMLVGTADVGWSQQRFYQSHGFVRVGTRERFFIENYPEPIIENGQQLVDMHVFACDLQDRVQQP